MIHCPELPQPLELVGNERKEYDRICSLGESRSDVVLVAVGLQPTDSAAKPSIRRVATAESIGSSRNRGLFCIAIPAWLSGPLNQPHEHEP
jgi:hypothetical protein